MISRTGLPETTKTKIKKPKAKMKSNIKIKKGHFKPPMGAPLPPPGGAPMPGMGMMP